MKVETTFSNPSRETNTPMRKAGHSPWRLWPTPEYLRALREAEQTVFQALMRRVVLYHTVRLDPI